MSDQVATIESLNIKFLFHKITATLLRLKGAAQTCNFHFLLSIFHLEKVEFLITKHE